MRAPTADFGPILWGNVTSKTEIGTAPNTKQRLGKQKAEISRPRTPTTEHGPPDRIQSRTVRLACRGAGGQKTKTESRKQKEIGGFYFAAFA